MEEAVKEIVTKGGQAICVKMDVTDRQQVKHLVAETEKAFGPVDILVNNAGYYYFTMMTSLMEDTWEKIIDINCKGVMNGIGAVLDSMVKRKTGHIVNISSESGRWADPGMTVYCGSKFFVEGMTQSLRKEVAAHGIKVTAIQPGFIDTEGIRRPFEKEAEDKYHTGKRITMLTEQEVADSVIYALKQPSNVVICELLVQPMEQIVYLSSEQAE